jgi:hypothetical protein
MFRVNFLKFIQFIQNTMVRADVNIKYGTFTFVSCCTKLTNNFMHKDDIFLAAVRIETSVYFNETT